MAWLRIADLVTPVATRSSVGHNALNSQAYGLYPSLTMSQGEFLLLMVAILGKIPAAFIICADTLNWESLEVDYSEFLQWALSGDLDTFYENVRWQQWREDVQNYRQRKPSRSTLSYGYKAKKQEQEKLFRHELWEMQYQMKETFTQ